MSNRREYLGVKSDVPLDVYNFFYQVHGDLPCEAGDIHHPQQTRKHLHDTRWLGRISGASGTCHTCGGSLLPTVFPLLYCGKCRRYTCDSNEMAEVHMENGKEKEEVILP